MGLFLIYRKSAETPTEVEYIYGHAETELDGRVLIDKDAPGGSPKEGPSDPIAFMVIGKANQGYRRTGSWPGGGAIQS